MQDLIDAMVEMNEAELLELTKKYLENGTAATDVLKGYQEAMSIVGKRFEEEIYFIPELILSGEMMKQGSALIGPYLKDVKEGANIEGKKKFLLATVHGDIHDIGKDIVHMMMELNGFEVLDLGVDVPSDEIIAEAKTFQADIIGLSGLLTLAYEPMKQVVGKLKEAGLRDACKVIIGGAQTDETICEFVGADGYATDVVSGVNQCKQWMVA
ncbi:MAG: cobalamin-dependent protein [Desulfobacteraceae bacterium]|jgi:5-methyltetrahydrofolate--homocysteine methyltransferase